MYYKNWPKREEKLNMFFSAENRDTQLACTVNQGPVSFNYEALNDKHVFLYLNSTIQTLKATVWESSQLFLYWNQFSTKLDKFSFKFQKTVSTDPVTNLEILGCSFWFSRNLLVEKVYDRDDMKWVLIVVVFFSQK